MSSGIKNGKHHTINIYSVKFTLGIIVLMFFLPLMSSGVTNGKQWVIVIDAGHGGRDPGAVGQHSKEKDINLAIALKTGEYIEKNLKNVKVIYTRKTDVTIDLLERPRIANENNADLFISIHANKTNSKSVAGAETFILGLAKDQENLEIAMKENEVILLEDDYSTKYQGFDPKSPESYIMFTLMQNVFKKQSTELAWKIQTQFTQRVERKDRGVKQAGFWVLFNTSMPSVLIETGFLSNPTEEKFLISEQGQEYMASAIFRACRDYIQEIDSRSVVLAELNIDTTKVIRPTQLAGNIPSEDFAFMVQIAASSTRTEIKPENFNGLKDILEIISQDRYKYASGRFSEYSDAVKYRKEIRDIYPDAFVIAVKNNEIIPLQQVINQKKKKLN